MSLWAIFWIVLGLILGIVELLSFTFILIWISISAIVTGIVAFQVDSWTFQVVLFAVASIVLLLLSRPFARRMRSRRTFRTRTESMVGHEGKVIQGAPAGQRALVRVDGEVWSASCDVPLQEEDSVLILSASSAVLQVSKL
ncbi:MAG: NfeD family protein [Alicyclobacillaceae bacterium]|uniref:NfeD family protein n=1 Tax=Alicyclobacillus sp. SP_1 TaxID=2942475 RepID=UPI002157F7EF|nr:NfeD family protein [Alicyclobacillus sp. SP_1]MCY0888105.1 NfeD family protein [Alicyclobacillaceae bacterium]MCY0895294.1 NfeD family protein [Alicyclobacillaceae bacterium]